MSTYTFLPTKRRDRYIWYENDTSGLIMIILGFQSLWVIGWYLRSLGFDADLWGFCFFVAGAMTLVGIPVFWAERHGGAELELWPRRGMFVWQPRGAYVACAIEGVVVCGDGETWHVELTSRIPRNCKDEDPPLTRIRVADAANGEEGEQLAQQWLADLNLPSDSQIPIEVEPIRNPATPEDFPIEAFTPSRSLEQIEYHGVMEFPETGMFQISFLVFPLIYAARICTEMWKEISTSVSPSWLDVGFLVLVVSLGLIVLVQFLKWCVVGERLELNLRDGLFYRWRGIRCFAKVRSGELHTLKPLGLVRLKRAFVVWVDTGDGKKFGLFQSSERSEALESMLYWAERFGLPWEDRSVSVPTGGVAGAG